MQNIDPLTPSPDNIVQCYPNPCKTNINIKFQADNNPISIVVYNTKGQVVRHLVQPQILNPGEQTILWDGRDNRGQVVPAGMYILKIHNGRYSSIKK